MDYVVERVSESIRIEPTGGQGERQQKREHQQRKGRRDSVSISDEARRRSSAESAEE